MIYDDKTIDEVLEMDRLEYVENVNPVRADELKDPHRAIKIELLAIITTFQEPVCCNKIFRDFEEINGEPLDPTKYGFKSFSSMMRTFSDKFNCHVDFGKTMYSAKTTERSGHLQDLIRNQVTIEEKRRRDMKRARSYSRPRRRSNYGAGIFYAQNFVPLFADERTEEERIADNLISFGRSLAEVDSRGRGPNWGGMRSGGGGESSDDDENDQGMGMRSKSVPPSRGAVFEDPDANGALEDCTNPFRSQNNERIRNIVIRHGEMDDSGRKGLALTELAAKFKEEYKQPLGGVPNIREHRLLEKMRKVDTTEWIVEKMGDDVAYAIVEAATLKRVEEEGFISSPMTPNKTGTLEAPRSPCVSPAGKRMLSYELKSAESNNNRMMNTRERNLQERAKSLSELTRYGADSDGDPVAMDSQEECELEKGEIQEGGGYGREAILALSDHDILEEQMVKKVADLKLLRKQSSPSSGSSTYSSLSGSRRGMRPTGPPSRPTPPVNSFSMWSSQSQAKPSTGFGSFKNASPSVKDSDDDDSSGVLQPSKSSLASMLPTFSKATATATAVPSSKSFGPGSSLPSFGTTSQSVPASTPASRVLPTFGSTASSSSTSGFPSAIGGSKISSPPPVTHKNEHKGSEILGATIQLIEKLQSGAMLYMGEIERTPVEEVVANNPDFFDIDENERVHLLHKDVKVELLMFEGKAIGELLEEEKKKVETPAKASAAGAFSRPNMPTFGGARPMPTFGSSTNSEEKPSAFASMPRETPTFGGNRPVKVSEECEKPASAMPLRAETTEPAKPRPGMPTFGATRKLIEVIDPPIVAAAPINVPPKSLANMPSFGTKSLEVQRPESALSNRSEDAPRKLPTFGGTKVVPTSEQPRPVQSAESDSTLDSDDEDTQESKYTTAASGFSSRNGESSLSSAASIQSSQSTLEAEEKEMEEESGPDSFPVHKDISGLCKKANLAFDSIHKGKIYLAALLTSFDPNRIVLTLCEDDMMEKLHMIMRELRSAYVDQTPLSVVKPGQFAIAINGEIVLRVVVLRPTADNRDSFEVACLDFNAVLIVDRENMYELMDRFGVHAVRSSTFVARVNLIPHLMSAGHSGVKMVVKNGEDKNDDSMKSFQPFVFHGVDERTGDMVVDVAIVMGPEVMWMGEAFPRFTGGPTQAGDLNPNIQSAIEYAVKHNVAGYDMSKEKAASAEVNSDQGLKRASIAPVKQEDKEEGELDSSIDDSTTSERTTVDRHAAGDFVREVKEELVDDEFVVVAPPGATPILNVESIVTLIRKMNANGENVDVDVVKAMARALILTVNKTLSTLGDRGALIANAEALEEIDMA